MSNQKSKAVCADVASANCTTSKRLNITDQLQDVEKFLSLICPPALEELQLLTKNSYCTWRIRNIICVLRLARDYVKTTDSCTPLYIHPRIMLLIMEHCSVNDTPEMVQHWAALLLTCLKTDPKDEKTIILIHILKQVTTTQVYLLFYICDRARKSSYKIGLTIFKELIIKYASLCEATYSDDVDRLTREVEHLYALNLIRNKPFELFQPSTRNLKVNVTPTTLAFHLYNALKGDKDHPYYLYDEDYWD